MSYPFLTLNDNTEITHSEMYDDGRVKVYIEKPVMGDFHSAVCWLPDYQWSEIQGYSPNEILEYQKLLQNCAATIMRFARGGGFPHATCL